MSITAIQEEIPDQPAAERARLSDLLRDSISKPQPQGRESTWAAESERRIDAYDAGKLSARDPEAVLADLNADCAGESAPRSTAELEYL
jgi:putative addiction module component (TIGR02574 family)